MWVINQDGFFSIVQKGGDEEKPLAVRARVRNDLTKFLKRIKADPRRIIDSTGVRHDYQYRAFLSRDELVKYQACIANALDYDNFKSSLPLIPNDNHLDLYHQLWSTLYALSDDVKEPARDPYHPIGFEVFPLSDESIPDLNNDIELANWRDTKIAIHDFSNPGEEFIPDLEEEEDIWSGINSAFTDIPTDTVPLKDQLDVTEGRGQKRRKQSRKTKRKTRSK